MLKLSWKFGQLKWNPVDALTSSSDTNYSLNEHENFWVIVSTRMMGADRQMDRRTDAGGDNNPSAEDAED